jgi:heme/copper-type cytochrome/quinol oxidase subunit 4
LRSALLSRFFTLVRTCGLHVMIGVFVVGLIVFGSMIIMASLNHAMMPVDRLMQTQR